MELKAVEKPSEPEETSQRTSIFIDLPDITKYFQAQGKNSDFQKLFSFLKAQFGKDTALYAYEALFQAEDLSQSELTAQNNYVKKLESMGYIVINSVKYVKNGISIETKGTEVALACDVVRLGHKNCDLYDTVVFVAGDHQKYRKLIEFIQTSFNKKIKTFFLSQKYEENYQEYLTFLEQTGTILKPDQYNTQPLPKRASNETMEKIKQLCPKNLRDKVNLTQNRKNNESKQLDTCAFIDYGNVHHHLMHLKRIDPKWKSGSEIDFLLNLKKKMELQNNLKKVKMFVGIPKVTIKDLEGSIKKKEREVQALTEQGFDVYFNFNEILYGGKMKEQGVDLRMAISVVHSALEGEFDKAILVSGDADFCPVVRHLRSLNKAVEVWSFTEPIERCPLSPFLYEEVMKKNESNNCSVKSLNYLFLG